MTNSSVAGESSNQTSGINTASVTLVIVAGDVLHLTGFASGTATSAVFSDSAGNTYPSAGLGLDSTADGSGTVNWQTYVAAPAAGSTIFTLTIVGSVFSVGIWVGRIINSAGVDAHAGTAVGFTSSPTGSLTIANAGGALVRAVGNADNGNGPAVADPGWTAGTTGYGSGASASSESLFFGSAGAQSIPFTFTGGAANVMAILAASFLPSAGGGVSKSLAGQSVASTEGALSRALAYSTLGQVIASSLGTISPAVSYLATGHSLTSIEGAIAASVSYGLAGQSLASSEGAITASTGNNVTLTLGGNLLQSTMGSINPALSKSVVGITLNSTEGVLAPGTGYSLSGRTIGLSEGMLSAEFALSLIGKVATLSEGALTPSQTGDVMRMLTGLQALFTPGLLIISKTGIGLTMPSVIGRNLEDATALLETAGVINPNTVGYFGTWPISVQWVKSPGPSFNVTAQSITAGSTVTVNIPIVLSVIQPPVGVSYE